MFGVPIDGSTNVYCGNEAVYQNIVIPESTLKKKHNSIAYHRCREAVAARTVRVAKQGTTKNLADFLPNCSLLKEESSSWKDLLIEQQDH